MLFIRRSVPITLSQVGGMPVDITYTAEAKREFTYAGHVDEYLGTAHMWLAPAAIPSRAAFASSASWPKRTGRESGRCGHPRLPGREPAVPRVAVPPREELNLDAALGQVLSQATAGPDALAFVAHVDDHLDLIGRKPVGGAGRAKPFTTVLR